MIIRNGIHSIFRSRKLCILFFILIAVLSMILTVGTGVFMASQATLESFRETYRTIGRLEYIGAEYPDETAADEGARNASATLDTDAISQVDGVISIVNKSFTLGYIDGFKRFRDTIPKKDYAVLIISSPHVIVKQLKQAELDDVPDFPDIYVITDTVTGMVTVHSYGYTEEIPNFIYNRVDHSLTQIVYENGEYTEITVSPDDLPAWNIITESGTGYKTEQYSGAVNLKDEDLKRYTYDPVNGTYCEEYYVTGEYSAYLEEYLYSRRDEKKIQIRFRPADFDIEFEEGHKYAVHGTFVDASTSNRVFELRPFDPEDDIPVLDVTDTDWRNEDLGIFSRYADYYRHANNYIKVFSADDISLLEDFHQDYLILEEGSFPRPGAADECVIDGSLASQLDLHTGDTLPLQLMTSQSSSIYRPASIEEPLTLRISGITASNNDYSGYVFIGGGLAFDSPFFGYHLGNVLLDNDKALSAAEQVQAVLPEHTRITVYDQGYETNCQPLKSMRTTSSLVTLIAAFTSIASLVLFAFLYIYRQRGTISTLFGLGLSFADIRTWMLSGVLCVSGAAALAGSVTGYLVQTVIFAAVMQGTVAMYATDIRYSQAGIGLTKQIETVMPKAVWTILVCTLMIMIVSAVLSLVFLKLAVNDNKPSRGKIKEKVPGISRTLKGRSIYRYGLISIYRESRRSLSVVLITCVLGLLLCAFSSLKGSWEKDLEKLYDETEITGNIVSLDGRYFTNLIIPENTLKQINSTGMVRKINVAYNSLHYWLEDEIPPFGTSAFSQESRAAWIAKQPRLIAVNTMDAAEDFFYAPAAITWADGYDESMFAGSWPLIYSNVTRDPVTRQVTPNDPYPAIVPLPWLEAHSLKPGDTVKVMNSDELPVLLTIAGTFQSDGKNIYIPLAAVYDPQKLNEDPLDRTGYIGSFSFTSCTFTMNSARDLAGFKTWLENMGFSQVNRAGRIRTAVVMNDSAFLDTLSSLNRQISFAGIIYPVLMAFTVFTGFIISWLMINGRRMDFAVMKGLGTDSKKVFILFFIEQAACALVGILPAFILSIILKDPLVIILFAASYLLGTAVSIWLIMKENLLVLLSYRE